MQSIHIRVSALITLSILTVSAQAADWQTAFNDGIKAAEQNKHKEAIRLFDQAIAGAEKAKGNEDEVLAPLLLMKARSQQAIGDHVSAEPVVLRCLKIADKHYGKNSLDTIVAVQELAYLYQGLEKYKEAAPYFRRCVEIREFNHGKQALETAVVVNAEAINFLHMKQPTEAEPLLRRTLDIMKAKLPKDDIQIGIVQHNLGGLCKDLGKFKDAETLFRDSLAVHERKLGKDHQQTAHPLSSLANLYLSQDNLKEAEPLFRRSLEIRQTKLPKDHLDLAQSLYSLGSLYSRIGKAKEAEPMLRRALEIREAKLPKDHEQVVDVLNNLGVLYERLDKLKEAEPYTRRCLEIAETKYLRDQDKLVQPLLNMCLLLGKMYRYEEAEKNGKRALEIRVTVSGKDDPRTADVLHTLAEMYERMGKLKEAEEHSTRCLKIREAKNPGEASEADALSNLANIHRQQDRFAQALELALRGIKIREAGKDKKSEALAQDLNAIGVLYQQIGQMEQAEARYLRALQLFQELEGKDGSHVGLTLHNLSALCHDVDRLSEAESYGSRSLEIREKYDKDGIDTAQSLNGLAAVYMHLAKNAEAEPLLRRSVSIYESRLGKDHPLVTAPLHNLSMAFHALGKDKEAEEGMKRCLAIFEKHKNNHQMAVTLHALAGVYRARDRRQEAEALYRQSIDIFEQSVGKDHFYVAHPLHSLAVLCAELGKLEESERLSRRSLEIREARLGKDHPDLALSLLNEASGCACLGKWKDAFRYADRSRRIDRRRVLKILPNLSAQEQTGFLYGAFETHTRVCLSMGLVRAEDAEACAYSAEWLANSKGIGHEALAAAEMMQRQSTGKAVKVVQELTQTRRQLARLTLAEPKQSGEEARKAEMEKLAQRERDLIRALREVGGTVSDFPDWIALDEIRKRIPAKGILIDFVRFETWDFEFDPAKQKRTTRYAVWLTSSDGTVKVVDLGLAEPIDKAVSALRKDLEAARNRIHDRGEIEAEKELQQSLKAVSQLLLHPLYEQIKTADVWLISPDSNLWLLPWSALPLPDGAYAIEKHALELLVSPRDLVRPPSKESKAGKALVMADPDYAKPDGKGAITALGVKEALRLDGSAGEGFAIRPLVEKLTGAQPRFLVEKEATEKELKAVERPRLLVLCTHGYFLPEQEFEVNTKEPLSPELRTRNALTDKSGKAWQNPLLRCGLLLAGCNAAPPKDGDDGILTGLEVLSMDLRGCELVVLSACSTGVGDVHNGEGVAGLRQAFQLAGAESVLSTLWQIPDTPSALLMSRTFQNMASGKNKSEALREAQLRMIDQRRKRYEAAHPYFWAAFTLTGTGK